MTLFYSSPYVAMLNFIVSHLKAFDAPVHGLFPSVHSPQVATCRKMARLEPCVQMLMQMRARQPDKPFRSDSH
jgi:hypothetical protein